MAYSKLQFCLFKHIYGGSMKYLRQASFWGLCIALIAVFNVSTGMAQIPRVTQPTVLNIRTSPDSTGKVCLSTSVTGNIALPSANANGVDSATLNVNTVFLRIKATQVKLTDVSYNTSGGGDAITLSPNTFLDPNTLYEFVVTSGLKDELGNSFIPKIFEFTTGVENCISPYIFTRFPAATPAGYKGKYSSVEIGPDNRLYATMTLGNPGGYIRIFDIQANGLLAFDRQLEFFSVNNKALIGIVFDPRSSYHPTLNPSGQLIMWVTVNNPLDYVNDHPLSFPFSGEIHKLTGTNINTGSENWVSVPMIVGLPRARKDHMVNSLEFGPDGALYVNVGSMSAMGRPDNGWKNQPETLLAGTVLRIDVDLLQQGTLPLNAKTGEAKTVDNPATAKDERLEVDETKNYGLNSVPPGYYDPRSANAPLTIYATGVRNAYDLLWHSNGQLYVPTNGSAAGGNTPAYTNSPACNNRINGQPYNGSTTVPQLSNVAIQADFLYRVQQGKYYGHPNILRCEFVLNGGNPTSGQDYPEGIGEVITYSPGVQPDPNFAGIAHSLGLNASANGVIEYKTNIYKGALRNWILVARYSYGNDIVAMNPIRDIDIDESMLLGFKNTGQTTFRLLSNPLDLVEDTRNGNLYVAEYETEDSITNGLISLLRPENPNAAPIAQNDVATGQQGETLTFPAPGVLANDSDLNNDPMIAVLVSTTSNGTLNLNQNGSFTYTPNGNFTGSDSFTYVARDNKGDDDGRAKTVTINILGPDVTPTATETSTPEPTDSPTDTPTNTPDPLTPSATPTATTTFDVPPATNTPDPLTPTSTLDPTTPTATSTPTQTPTATSTVFFNLVVNSGFEDRNGQNEPKLKPWVVKQVTGDKVVCNKVDRPGGKPDKIVAYENACAFQFKGGAGERNKLQQNLDVAGVVAGDTLVLEFAAQGKGLEEGVAAAQLKVKYADNKDKVKIDLPAGEFVYADTVLRNSLQMTAVPTKLKLEIRYRDSAGKLLVDAIVVLVNPPQGMGLGELLPLP
jgi:VCBS repeat-containing protein